MKWKMYTWNLLIKKLECLNIFLTFEDFIKMIQTEEVSLNLHTFNDVIFSSCDASLTVIRGG